MSFLLLNGLHQINELGQIVEIPRAERQAKRDAKPVGISDRAKTTEIYSGEKSFQTWANEIRIGDRLKHAKSWKDLHAAAAAYGCEVKEKSGGFVLCPAGQKGAISLSKIGLKKLPEKYGVFEKSNPAPQESSQIPPLAESKEKTYKPGPLLENGKTHYARWKESKVAFQIVKNDRGNAQREDHALTRQRLRVQHKSELAQIRATTPRPDQFAAISIAKMNQTVALATLNDIFAKERKSLRDELANTAPGNTFRDFLVIQAAKGDDIALGLARRYGWEEATDVLRQREVDQLKIVAAVQGQEDLPAPRLQITHQVERNGTVIYDFGNGRKIIDSAISKQVQLNAAAAHSPQAIATALRFATTKFGNTLSLTGTTEFQRLAVETAVSQRLGIKFADPELEAYRAQLDAQLDAQQRTAARLGASETRSKSRNRPGEIGTPGSSITPTDTGTKHIPPIQTTRQAPHEAEKRVVVAPEAGHQSLDSGPAPELDFLAEIHQQIDLAQIVKQLFFAGFPIAKRLFHRRHNISDGDDQYRFPAEQQLVANGGSQMVFAGAGFAGKDKAGDVAVKLFNVLASFAQGVHLTFAFHPIVIERTVLMQWTNTGTVECALHFHGSVFTGQRCGANFTLLFLPCQQLLARFKGWLDISRHHFLQTFHQVADVFHFAPRNPLGICLSGSENALISRLGWPLLLARLI